MFRAFSADFRSWLIGEEEAKEAREARDGGGGRRGWRWGPRVRNQHVLNTIPKWINFPRRRGT